MRVRLHYLSQRRDRLVFDQRSSRELRLADTPARRAMSC
jgi:hypothetical protein